MQESGLLESYFCVIICLVRCQKRRGGISHVSHQQFLKPPYVQRPKKSNGMKAMIRVYLVTGPGSKKSPLYAPWFGNSTEVLLANLAFMPLFSTRTRQGKSQEGFLAHLSLVSCPVSAC